jgi:phosphatidylserine/phosphatidylglycerophosphate/cardiolipin synthase-like enzyme
MTAMFISLFGTVSCASLMGRSTTVTPCFTPSGGCAESVAAEIGNAKSEVLIQAYTLTSKDIADAIVKAKETGVNIAIIMDRSSAHAQGSALYFSQLKGIPTFIDARHAAARSNVVIIDGETVITGGSTFTNEAGDRYAEDLVIIRSGYLAESYRENWNQHKDHSEEFKQQNGLSKSDPARKKVLKKKKGGENGAWISGLHTPNDSLASLHIKACLSSLLSCRYFYWLLCPIKQVLFPSSCAPTAARGLLT